MGYRKYAKDYEIEYVTRLGKKRPEAVRIYIGPYFRFAAPAETIGKLKWFYLVGVVLLAVLLLIPMCIDCTFTRTMYVQLPAAAAWIPWVLAVASVFRLWTAREKVEREHYDMTFQRMSGASLFLVIFCSISTIGCIVSLFRFTPTAGDWVVSGCNLAAAVCSVLLYSRRKGLEMIQEENPEKPHKKA